MHSSTQLAGATVAQTSSPLDLARAGFLAGQAGEPRQGRDMLRRALDAAPRDPRVHALAACYWQSQAMPDKATGAWRAALRLDPGQGLYARGLAQGLLAAGKAEEAARAFRQALIMLPDDPDSMAGLGSALRQSGIMPQAIAVLRSALRQMPNDAWLRNELGLALSDLGRAEEAAEMFRTAFALAPDYADSAANLSVAQMKLDHYEEAEQACRSAIRLAPNRAAQHANLSAILNMQARFGEAGQEARRAIALDPRLAAAWSNLGNALHEAQRHGEAAEAYRQAIAIDPRDAGSHDNLAVTLALTRALSQALTAHKRALALDPGRAEAHVNHALTLLRAGRWAEGWAENEWRWQTRGVRPHGWTGAWWHGERLAGKRILLFAEAGFGDTLQFVRFARLAAQRGGRVILRVQDELVRLFRVMPVIEKVVGYSDRLPEADIACALQSLPHETGQGDPGSVAHFPYLHAPDTDIRKARAWLGAGPELKVGLVWAGAPRRGMREAWLADQRRSMTLADCALLAGIAGVRLISLQQGEAAAQPAPDGLALEQPEGLDDFAATSGLIASLDLVITVDTSVAHLAGALGKPVWLLSRWDGCWRWGTAGDDTEWYPTMTIFRQEQPGDWAGVMERVRGMLARRVRRVSH